MYVKKLTTYKSLNFVCMNVCMFAYMYLSMYICMCLYTHVYV